MRQTFAAAECIAADAFHTVRYCNTGQRFTIEKRIDCDALGTLRNHDLTFTGRTVYKNTVYNYKRILCLTRFQPCCTGKRKVADACYAFRNRDVSHLFALGKSVAADACHTVRDHCFPDFRTVLIPRHRSAEGQIPVRHCALAGNCQDSEHRVKFPCERIAAGAGDHFIVERFKGDAVFLCEGFRISTGIALDCHLCAAGERAVRDAFHIGGDCSCSQLFAAGKRIFADCRQAFRKRDGFHAAPAECVAADIFHAIFNDERIIFHSLERRRILCCVIRHLALSPDSQGAFAVQCPDQILPAGAGL